MPTPEPTPLLSRPPAAPRAAVAPASAAGEIPSWVVGVCGVAAVASALFTLLLLLNR